MDKKYEFEAGIAALNFHCDWGVYDIKSDGEICRCTNQTRADLISVAVKDFIVSRKGKKWLKENQVLLDGAISWPLPMTDESPSLRYVVYPANKNSSMCYCWTPEGTTLVVEALNNFTNTRKGKKWIKKELS